MLMKNGKLMFAYYGETTVQLEEQETNQEAR